MDGSGEDDRDDHTGSTAAPDDAPPCAEAGCDRPAAVRLFVPWAEDRSVCPAHARVLARPDGVVAEPIEGAAGEWP